MAAEQGIVWGILGCGDVTEVKSGPALQKTARSRVEMVMRRDGAKAADYAKRHGVPGSTDDAQALIHHDALNAIYIATPPSTHAEYAIAAMRAGKDVLLEKPMALSTEECARIIAAQEETGAKLCVAFYRRALPRFERMREIIQGGEIGDVRLVEVRHFLPQDARPAQAWKLDPSIGGGGFFADMQTHTLDWLRYVFGAPQHAVGHMKQQTSDHNAEDLVTYMIDFGAVNAIGLCAYAAHDKDENVIVHGSAGRVSMGFFRPSAITLTTDAGRQEIDLPDPAHVHQPFVERVVAHFLEDAPNPCPANEAQVTNALLEQFHLGF